jgi:hypothetical protein
MPTSGLRGVLWGYVPHEMWGFAQNAGQSPFTGTAGRSTLPVMDPTSDPTSDRATDPTTDPITVTVADAAKLLGLSTEAVRMRVKRGTLASTRVAGTVYVLLSQPNAGPNGQPNGRPNDRPNDLTALVRSLEDQVAYLRRQLATRDEELRRKDHLLAAALERIPELLPSPDPAPRNGHETVAEEPEGTDSPSTSAAPQEGSQRHSSWWRRFFGFE